MNISKINVNANDQKYLQEAFVPLGLFGFAITTILLSLYNLEAFGPINADPGKNLAIVFISICAIFLGGFLQVLAGLYTIRFGHIKTGSVLCSFGAFWLIWGIFNLIFFLNPAVTSAWLSDVNHNPYFSYKDIAVGIFLLLYFVISLISFYVNLYRNKITSLVFLVLIFAFLFLGISDILHGASKTEMDVINNAEIVRGLRITGGFFALLAGIGALYLAWAIILSRIFNKNLLAVGRPFLYAKNKSVFDIKE